MRRASAVVGGLAYLFAVTAWALLLALVGYLALMSIPSQPIPDAQPDSGLVTGGDVAAEDGSNLLVRILATALGIVVTFGALALVVILPLLFTRWCSRQTHILLKNLFGKNYRLQHLVAVKALLAVVPVVILGTIWAVSPNFLTASLAAGGAAVASAALLLSALQLVLAKSARLSVKEIF